ncbi:MAG: hypothetical protein ACOY3L_18075 [Pseudomonadota bacterium]
MPSPHRSTSHPAPADRASGADPRPVYCFAIQAAADPGAIARVLEPFAKRGLVPSRCHAVLAGPEREELLIDVQVAGLAPEEGDQIARHLRQQVLVASVLTCVSVPAVPLERIA